MHIPQHFPQETGTLHRPDRKMIETEPVFRRGTPDFVRKMGGDFARKILSVAEAWGMVRDTTRIMTQKTPIVAGKYPDIPQWHVDCVPGLPAKLADTVRARIDGLICVIVDEQGNPEEQGTLFLEGGLLLEGDDESDTDYKPNSHLSDDAGDINWIHPQVETQIGSTLKVSALKPNTIYRYTSANFHKAPILRGNAGKRMVIRLNTPPEDFPQAVPFNDRIITPEPQYVFEVNQEHTKWVRENLAER